jgi:SulP family sulfate permease
MHDSLVPKFSTTLRYLTKEQFFKDVVAGIIVGIIAIPLSIALGISSGVTPIVGINTAIIAGFLMSLLGGSRVQIGGPTAAFVPIVYTIVQQHGVAGLTIALIMAGIFIAAMGFFRMGRMIKFIPFPITVGFTSGIAVSIGHKQIKDFLGLSIPGALPADFIELTKVYLEHISTFNLHTVLVGMLALAVVLFWGKLPWAPARKVPGSVPAILLSTLLVQVSGLSDVVTIGGRYGDLAAGLPSFQLPGGFSLSLIPTLIGPAISIALLASIESLLSAVVADGMIGGRHRPNAELMALGIANIGSALFGGIPATGAIARTAANVKNGGRTPIAGMVHALTVLAITLLFMRYAKLIPLTTLAVILIMVAYHMGEWKHFAEIFKIPRSDATVFLLTFLLTVIFDLVVAIEAGMILTAFLFMKRMSDVTEVRRITRDRIDDHLEDAEIKKRFKEAHGDDTVMVYEISGPFFFGAADKFMNIASSLSMKTSAIIIKMREVPALDQTALHFIELLHAQCSSQNTRMYLTDVRSQPLRSLKKARLTHLFGESSICPDVASAIRHFEECHLKT